MRAPFVKDELYILDISALGGNKQWSFGQESLHLDENIFIGK